MKNKIHLSGGICRQGANWQFLVDSWCWANAKRVVCNVKGNSFFARNPDASCASKMQNPRFFAEWARGARFIHPFCRKLTFNT
jgi:hypothetical protein